MYTVWSCVLPDAIYTSPPSFAAALFVFILRDVCIVRYQPHDRLYLRLKPSSLHAWTMVLTLIGHNCCCCCSVWMRDGRRGIMQYIELFVHDVQRQLPNMVLQW